MMKLIQLLATLLLVCMMIWMMPCVESNAIDKRALGCLNQMESSKGQCFLGQGKGRGQCCHVFNSDECWRELTTADDDASPYVGFLPSSLTYEEDRNQICINGLEMRAGDKTNSLFGFQVSTRKWHKNWPIEEVSSLNFMLPLHPSLPPVVPKDPKLNPLKDLLMCIGIGKQIDSTIPDVYLDMELIPLKPSKHSTALRYPQNSINICALDFVHLVKESRCEVRVELTKHTCGRQTSQPITTEFAETENETTTNQPVLQIPQIIIQAESKSHLPGWAIVLIAFLSVIIIFRLVIVFIVRRTHCWQRQKKQQEDNHSRNTEPINNSVNNSSYNQNRPTNHASPASGQQREELQMTQAPDQPQHQPQMRPQDFHYDPSGIIPARNQSDYSYIPDSLSSNAQMIRIVLTSGTATKQLHITTSTRREDELITADEKENDTSTAACFPSTRAAFSKQLSEERSRAAHDPTENRDVNRGNYEEKDPLESPA